MSGNHSQNAGSGQATVAHRTETGEAQGISFLRLDSATGEEDLARADAVALLEQFPDEAGRSAAPNDMVAGPDEGGEVEVVEPNFHTSAYRAFCVRQSH